MRLSYRTREEISPQGLPRVYLACHREDLNEYLDEIASDILRVSNCAAFYYDGEPELDEEYYENLSGMNLMVMPVTSRLLSTENRALKVEFTYAMTHHIPVLPIMLERGLERGFNEICGNLQFLEKNSADHTALPYMEKLEKYLTAILVGDELAAKVRGAFRGYIFLSYRKKDRKLAQQLMNLIHSFPSCREIAIWYDEYLVPGENFNSLIQAALESSDLFVLATTPNLVNERNYVMDVEYPMAREIGKPIVPVEMERTESKALRENYSGIPDAVNPLDGKQLEAAVLRHLQPRTENRDSEPLQDYLIGLAYLSGIDVEVDHGYAVKRLLSAAEAGLPDAMEKLAKMYEIGEGVPNDHAEELKWRHRLTGYWRQEYRKTGEEAAGRAFVKAALEEASCGVYCYLGASFFAPDRKGFRCAEKLCKEALRIARLLKKKTPSPHHEKALLDCFNELGKLYSWYGRRADRIRYMEVVAQQYQRALEIAKELVSRYPDEETWFMLGDGYRRCMIACTATRKMEDQVYALCGELMELALSREKVGDWRCAALGVSAGNNLVVMAKDFHTVETRSAQTFALAQNLVRQQGGFDDYIALCGLCEQIGLSYGAWGHMGQAEEWIRRALDVLRTVPGKKYPDIRAGVYSACSMHLGCICLKNGKTEEALEKFRETVAAWERGQAEKEKHYKGVRSVDLTLASRSLGEYYWSVGQPDEARKWFLKTLRFQESIVNLHRNEEEAVKMVDMCLDFGEKLQDRGLIRNARRINWVLVESSNGKKRYIQKEIRISKLLFGSAVGGWTLGIRYCWWTVRNLFRGKNSKQERKPCSLKQPVVFVDY